MVKRLFIWQIGPRSLKYFKFISEQVHSEIHAVFYSESFHVLHLNISMLIKELFN